MLCCALKVSLIKGIEQFKIPIQKFLLINKNISISFVYLCILFVKYMYINKYAKNDSILKRIPQLKSIASYYSS